MRVPRRDIPPERKTLYTVGMVVSALGLLSFLSTFITFMWHFGDFSNFEANARSDGFRAFGGMIAIIAGGMMMNVAARGIAGSGLTLDPQQSRRDLEPWSRAAGGMAADALEEAGIELSVAGQDFADLPLDEKLRRLHGLYRDGVITCAEYDEAKKKILDAAQ